MRSCCFLCVLPLCLGCATAQPAPDTTMPSAIVEPEDELLVLPERVGASSGHAVALAKGDIVPFDGILLDEPKAFAAAELRIAYDELYAVASIQQRTFQTSTRILKVELGKADREIDGQAKMIDDLKNSWWARNKMVVGIVGGLVIGIAGSLTAGWVWSQMDD